MDLHFDPGGVARVVVQNVPRDVARALTDSIRPWTAAAPGPANVEIAVTRQLPAPATERLGDAGDGRRTRRAGDWLVVDGRVGWFAVRWGGVPRYVASTDLPVSALVRDVIMPAVFGATAANGGSVVHGCAVQLPGAVPLIVGWSESGKTETALALAARGGILTGDKWSLLGNDGRLVAAPGPIHIRDWVAEYLPELAPVITAPARGRASLAGLSERSLRTIARRFPGQAGIAADRIADVAELGTRTRAQVAAVNRTLGRGDVAFVKPTHLVLLRTTDGPMECRSIPGAQVVEAIAASSAFERRGERDLEARAAYLGLPVERPAPDIEHAVLARLLGSLRAIEIRAPFPTDPRLVADQVLGFVGS